MIVLDASAVIELLLRTATGKRVAHFIEDPRESLHAPALLDLEVAQVARRLVRAQIIDATRGAIMLHHLQSLDIERHPHEELMQRVWPLTGHISAYDAAYLALAEALDAPLLTADAKLCRAGGHEARLISA